MQTIDTLITARWVLPLAPGVDVLEHAAVAVHRGRIESVLPQSEAATRFRADEVVERPHHVLLPGLINAHVHSPMTLLRGLAEDCPPSSWLGQHIWPAERRWLSGEFVRDGALLAIAEMLSGGVTCFADVYPFPDVIAKCAADQGIRVAAGLLVAETPSAWAESLTDHIAQATTVHDHYREHPLVSTYFALHSANAASDETLRRVRVLADQLEMSIALHLHETADEIQLSLQEFDARPIARLESLGLLTPSLVAVHMTQLQAEEIMLLARAGVHVVHCPESNLKLGSGYCPLSSLLEAGINVALGTDTAAANNDLDVLGELRTAALLAKGLGGDPRTLGARRALELVTLNAARVLGLNEQIGSLEPGKWADICCLDLADPSTQPLHDVAAAVVYSAHRDQVCDVWVGGRRLLADGSHTRIDQRRLLSAAASWQERIAASSTRQGTA